MVAMASFFDVVYLQDSLCLSCKDGKKQRRLRYSILSALLAMVEMFRALHSLCITLLPFALLWWNVMLHAMCAKFYTWNRTWLWLQQAAARSVCADIVQESRTASEASMAEEKETFSNSSHLRGSSDDAHHVTGITEMSIVPLCRPEACEEVDAHAEKKDVCSLTLHPGRKMPQGFSFAMCSFPHQGMLHAINQDVDVVAECLEEWCSRRLEELAPACEATPHFSKAQTVSETSHISKLSSLCFLEVGVPQVPQYHWAVCASLLRPIATSDVCLPPSISIPLELSCLQINLDRNCELLHLDHYKSSVCIDHISIDWSLLRNWLQSLNGRCVPRLDQGKQSPSFEGGVVNALTGEPLNNNIHTISSYGTTANVKLCIAVQPSLLDLSGCRVKNSNAYVENGGSGLDSTEDIDSTCCSSGKSDDECDGAYCTRTEFTTDSNDGLDYSDMLYGAQGHRDDECRYYQCCLSADDTENVYASVVYLPMDTDNSFYDSSGRCCNVGYIGSLCGTELDGICSTDYYADDSGYTNRGGNVDVSGAIYGDGPHKHEYGAYGSPVEIHAVNLHTWWDKDAVLLDVKEAEEEKIDEDWQVV